MHFLGRWPFLVAEMAAVDFVHGDEGLLMARRRAARLLARPA